MIVSSLKKLGILFSLGVSSTTIFVVIANRPSFAFSVKPKPPDGASKIYLPGPIKFEKNKYLVTLDPIFVTATTNREREKFQAFLEGSPFGKKWVFKLPKDAGGNVINLNGHFVVLNYSVCLPTRKCPHFPTDPPSADDIVKAVGGVLELRYRVGRFDPRLDLKDADRDKENTIHWIQVLNTTRPEFPKKAIDVSPHNKLTPFYDDGFTADMTRGLFVDPPFTQNILRNNSDFFELYLVEKTAGKNEVTIYNGVNWGWRSQKTCNDPCEDFGDAPDTYKTLLGSDGPRYKEGNLQRLGLRWDEEVNGQPTPLADGDDKGAPFDDEDGVIFGKNWVDVTFNISRPGNNPYQLRAWWDKNKNGVFDHAGELFINDLQNLGPGISSKRYDLTFDPRKSYSRFRLTCDPLDPINPNNPDVKPFGQFFSKPNCGDPTVVDILTHGEVEDYVPEPMTILGTGLVLGFLPVLKKTQSKK